MWVLNMTSAQSVSSKTGCGWRFNFDCTLKLTAEVRCCCWMSSILVCISIYMLKVFRLHCFPLNSSVLYCISEGEHANIDRYNNNFIYCWLQSIKLEINHASYIESCLFRKKCSTTHLLYLLHISYLWKSLFDVCGSSFYCSWLPFC